MVNRITPKIRPYRVNVFAIRLAKGKRTPKLCQLVEQGIGWQGWTPHQHCGPEARLPGAGSFLFAGALRAIEFARHQFANPCVHQVAIKTDQDRDVLRYYRQADGSFRYYGAA